MDRIIYTENGIAAVVVPTPEWKGTLDELAAKVLPENTPYELADVSEIPSDRTFRDAWKRGEQGKKIGVDMVKAKEIGHEKRRAVREETLAPLDKEINIKIGNSSQVQAIESQRQSIRDADATVQTNIDAATTPEELKTILADYGAI